MLKELLSSARGIIAEKGIEDASLECELLMMHTLGIDRVKLYQDLYLELSPKQEKTFWRLVQRRLDNEPTAYITGHREFYGLDFSVNASVLIPRPETELLVDKALEYARGHKVSSIADIGTGSGAIAITLALHLPEAKIYATDISDAALKVALLNAEKQGVTERIHFLQGDLLEPLPEPVDLVVANLPYVKDSDLEKMPSLGFEPVAALSGGKDGLEKIRPLCSRLNWKLHSGCLLLEIGQGQRELVVAMLQTQFPSAAIEVTPDLGGIDRVVALTLSS